MATEAEIEQYKKSLDTCMKLALLIEEAAKQAPHLITPAFQAEYERIYHLLENIYKQYQLNVAAEQQQQK